MREDFIRRARTNPRLYQQVKELAERVSEITRHDVDIKVIAFNPPIFTVLVDHDQVDDWMPWEQTIMFLRGLLVGISFDDAKAFNDGIRQATAEVQAALTQMLSQDRDTDTAKTVDA